MNEEKVITVTCPKCGTKLTEAVQHFKTPGKFCPSCCRPFSSERFKAAIKKAEEE